MQIPPNLFDKAVEKSKVAQVTAHAPSCDVDNTNRFIDLVLLINTSDRTADGCPRLVNKATANISVSEKSSLSDVEHTLLSQKYITANEPIEFGINRDDSIVVLDKNKSLSEHGIIHGAVVTVLPKRINISIVALDNETSTKLSFGKPIGLIVRSDYRFVDIERPVCSHLKVPVNSLTFRYNDKIVREKIKTMRELGISDGSIIKVSLS
jgi:hypothetical protein